MLSDVKVGVVVVVTSADGNIVKRVKVARSIPFGHKIAIARIGRNELVLKYGEVLGHRELAIYWAWPIPERMSPYL